MSLNIRLCTVQKNLLRIKGCNSKKWKCDYKEIKKEKDLFYQGTGYQQKWKSWCVECSEKVRVK